MAAGVGAAALGLLASAAQLWASTAGRITLGVASGLFLAANFVYTSAALGEVLSPRKRGLALGGSLLTAMGTGAILLQLLTGSSPFEEEEKVSKETALTKTECVTSVVINGQPAPAAAPGGAPTSPGPQLQLTLVATPLDVAKPPSPRAFEHSPVRSESVIPQQPGGRPNSWRDDRTTAGDAARALVRPSADSGNGGNDSAAGDSQDGDNNGSRPPSVPPVVVVPPPSGPGSGVEVPPAPGAMTPNAVLPPTGPPAVPGLPPQGQTPAPSSLESATGP
jgi:hypothetical protein